MSLFYLFLAFLYSLLIQLPMTGIKLRISSVGSNRSTNFLLQLSNCMMETCMLLAAVRVHEHW